MRRYNNNPVNKWFTPECESMRNKYMSLKNKIKDAQSHVSCQDLYAQLHTKFIEYKKLTHKAKRKYEIQFHNELRTMKSEKCKDYWAVINEHSPNDPHKFVINLEVFKMFFENLNRNPRINHVTSILNSQLIVKSHINENNDINMPFTGQEVTAAIKRLKNNKSAGMDGILNEFLKHCPMTCI